MSPMMCISPCVCAAVSKAATGSDNMELIQFNVQLEPVSIHQPLVRLLAGGL